MAKNEKHYKTRQVVAQATGNTGAQLARSGARNAAEQGLKRMAAHERAMKDITAAREATAAEYNQIVQWQNNRLDAIRRRGRQRVDRITGRADQAMRNAYENELRAVRNRTSQMESAVQRRAMDARAAGQRATDAKAATSRGVFARSRGPALPQSPKLNPVRAAEIAENNARVAQGRALNDLKRLRVQAPAREAKEAMSAANRTARAIEANANRVVAQTRAAEQNVIRVTRKTADEISRRFAEGAARTMEQAGPKATFFQRAMAKMSQVGRPLAGSAVENVAAPTRSAVENVAVPTRAAAKKGLGLFASRAEIAARVAEIGRTSPKTAAALRRAGLIAEGVVKKGGGLVARAAKKGGILVAGATKKAITHWGGLRLPVKMIAGGLDTIEAAGKLVAGSGKPGKVVTGLTNASGLAGGFAMGAWIDAGLNWAEASADARKMGYTGFFGKGGMWEALGKVNHTETVRDDDGVEHVVDYRNPALGRVVTSKEYWGEVTRGTLRNLTFGLFGKDKYEWEQDGRSPEESSKLWNARYLAGLDPDTGEVIRDRNGNDVSHILAKQRLAEQSQVNRAKNITAYFMSFDPANKDKVKGVGNASLGRGALGFAENAQTDAVGFITAVKHLGELKDQQIEAARQMAVQGGQNRHVDRRMSQLQRSGMTREQAVEAFMQEVGKHQNKQYEKRLGMMLKSDAAAKASDMNRKFAYLALTGRDYDVDTKSDLAEGAKQGYTDFNAAWGELSDRDRVLFDREVFGKSIVDTAASEYKTMTGTKEEEVSDGDAEEPAS